MLFNDSTKNHTTRRVTMLKKQTNNNIHKAGHNQDQLIFSNTDNEYVRGIVYYEIDIQP